MYSRHIPNMQYPNNPSSFSNHQLSLWYDYDYTLKWIYVIILIKFLSLDVLKVVKMTTFSAASDENFIKMTTFLFQYICSLIDVFLFKCCTVTIRSNIMNIITNIGKNKHFPHCCTGPLWGKPPYTSGFPWKGSVMRSFDVFFIIKAWQAV